MRCKARAKSTGARCGKAAIPGGAVCRMHGGGAPQVQRAAVRRLRTYREDPLFRDIEEEVLCRSFSSTLRRHGAPAAGGWAANTPRAASDADRAADAAPRPRRHPRPRAAQGGENARPAKVGPPPRAPKPANGELPRASSLVETPAGSNQTTPERRRSRDGNIIGSVELEWDYLAGWRPVWSTATGCLRSGGW